MSTTLPRPLKIGIGGPVGSGKTALTEALCLRLRDGLDMAVITNDIYTKEDAEFLVRRGALPPARVVGVETGGCPHTAIREDASVNLEAVRALTVAFPALDLLLIESGGDNLAATFSPELVDATIYVIDVAEGEKIPRKGGPGIIALRPARHQQDRPGAARGRRPRRDGARRAAQARRPALRVHQPQERAGGGRDPRVAPPRPAAGAGVTVATRVGRDGTLRLRFERRAAATVLAGVPLHAARCRCWRRSRSRTPPRSCRC